MLNQLKGLLLAAETKNSLVSLAGNSVWKQIPHSVSECYILITFYLMFPKWVALLESSFSSLNNVSSITSLSSLGWEIFYSLTRLSPVSNPFFFFLDPGRALAGGSEGGSGGSEGRIEGSEGGIGEFDGSDVPILGAFPSRPGAMLPLQRMDR